MQSSGVTNEAHHPAQQVLPYVQQRRAAVANLLAAQASASVAAKLAATAPTDLKDRYDAEAEEHMKNAKAHQSRIDAIDAVVEELGDEAVRWYGIVRDRVRKQEAAEFEASAAA